MTNQFNTSSLFSYFLLLIFFVLISIPFSYADNNGYEGRDYGYMGHGHMEHGYMGRGYMEHSHMGQGHMGYEHIGKGCMDGMGYGFYSRLDLSNEQRASIRNIHKEMRSQKIALQDKMAELRDELDVLYKVDKPSEKKVGAVYSKIFDLRRQQIELNISIKNKTYDVLNKEQKEKLKELKSSGSSFRHYQGMQGRGMHTDR